MKSRVRELFERGHCRLQLKKKKENGTSSNHFRDKLEGKMKYGNFSLDFHFYLENLSAPKILSSYAHYIPNIAISSACTSNIYLEANTKGTDKKFSRNLQNTIKKKHFNGSYSKQLPFARTQCHKCLGQSSIDSQVMAREISFATVTISVFSDSKFWCLQAQARSSSNDHNL